MQGDFHEHFLKRVLFSDEATFTRAGLFNNHNMYSWQEENPHELHRFRYQHRFSINVWTGIVGDSLIGPYLRQFLLNGQQHVTFFRETLPLLLEDFPLHERRRMWFQHDGLLQENVANILTKHLGTDGYGAMGEWHGHQDLLT